MRSLGAVGRHVQIFRCCLHNWTLGSLLTHPCSQMNAFRAGRIRSKFSLNVFQSQLAQQNEDSKYGASNWTSNIIKNVPICLLVTLR